MECTASNCEAHLFMSESVKELKITNAALATGQQTLTITVSKLAENLSEMHRMSMRLENLISDQTKKNSSLEEDLSKQRDFMNRAIGVIGALTLMVPIISEIIKYFINR